MRYWIYDEDGKLFRKFWEQETAVKLLQPGWKLVVQPKEKKVYPTPELYGEARW